MVVVSILRYVEFGPNDQQEDAPHFPEKTENELLARGRIYFIHLGFES